MEHPFAVLGEDGSVDVEQTRQHPDAELHYSPRELDNHGKAKLQVQTANEMSRTISQRTPKSTRQSKVLPLPGTPTASSTETGPLVSAAEN